MKWGVVGIKYRKVDCSYRPAKVAQGASFPGEWWWWWWRWAVLQLEDVTWLLVCWSCCAPLHPITAQPPPVTATTTHPPAGEYPPRAQAGKRDNGWYYRTFSNGGYLSSKHGECGVGGVLCVCGCPRRLC
jgi:hypothetical protein